MEDSTKIEENSIKQQVKKSRGRPAWPSKDLIVIGKVERTGEAWSGKYVWPDKIAMKKKLTYKEKAFVDEYLESHNASAAYRASKWTLANPEERLDSDRPNWMYMKRKEKIKQYLQEKIMTDAAECLDIQMDLIRNEKTPAAVRNAAIVDRLNRMWIGKEKEESTEFQGIWEVTITIKHKQPDIIDMDNMDNVDNQVEILDSNNGEENDVKDFQSELWDDWETSWSTRGADWQED